MNFTCTILSLGIIKYLNIKDKFLELKYRMRAIITCVFHTLYPIFNVKKRLFKELFQKFLTLCMVSIQERFIIKSKLWWPTHGNCFWNDQFISDSFLILLQANSDLLKVFFLRYSWPCFQAGNHITWQKLLHPPPSFYYCASSWNWY